MSTKSVPSINSLLPWSIARIVLGLIFLWAFVDKLFGLGFATKSGKSWIDGISPTAGFLKHATQGPLADFYQSLAGRPVVDCLFMIGLLGIGLALLLGIGLRIAGYTGALLMVLMWSSVLPPANNPVLDEHLVYALVLLGIAHNPVGSTLGFADWWSKTALVKKFPILK